MKGVYEKLKNYGRWLNSLTIILSVLALILIILSTVIKIQISNGSTIFKENAGDYLMNIVVLMLGLRLYASKNLSTVQDITKSIKEADEEMEEMKKQLQDLTDKNEEITATESN